MGYPMTYRRIIERHYLYGNYDYYPSTPLNRRTLTGDLRRLEEDQRDPAHLAVYAQLAGIEPVEAKIVLDAFFEGFPDGAP